MKISRILVIVLIISVYHGCGNDSVVVEETFSDCDPLDPSLCALPFPSSFFLKEDRSTPTGYRVDFRETTLPVDKSGIQMNPSLWNEKDGFSTLGPILTYFENLSSENLLSHTNLDAYSGEDVTTIIVDAEKGERVPHFAEVDATTEDPHQALLIIWPVVPLKHATRYIVGYRGLKTLNGDDIEPSYAFKSLRDGIPTDDYDVEGRREHFDEKVFPVLEEQGFKRDELILAFDFVTVSRENSLGRLEFMRDDAIERMGEGGPPYRIISIEDSDCSEGALIGRTIYGEMTVPFYTEDDSPGTLLTRDEDGMPYYNGETTADFLVRIPCSLIEEPSAGLILQYGHGLFGSKDEATSDYLNEMAYAYGWVICAVEWTGMCRDDISAVISKLADDPSNFAVIPERSMQGFIEQVALLKMMRGSFREDEAVTFDGISVIDPERYGFYGNSQGAILGGGYMGLSSELTRGVLGVGGTPFSLISTRSAHFDSYILLLKTKFNDYREIFLYIGLIQMLWEPAESAGWLTSMNQSPPEGIPSKDVLIQVAIGDAAVTTLAAHIMARGYRANTVAPQTREIWGIEEKEAPFTGSAIVEWYYPDAGEEPVENVPPDPSLNTHECPRREWEAQEQIRDFLETGIVNQYCDGICQGLRQETCGDL